MWNDLSKMLFLQITVDGRNPAQPKMYENPANNGIFTISTGAGFLPSKVSVLYLSFLGRKVHDLNSRGVALLKKSLDSSF